MNETEKQIVAWLRGVAKNHFEISERYKATKARRGVKRHALAGATALDFAYAIERGEHRKREKE